jgi:phosphoglycolate phosphatase
MKRKLIVFDFDGTLADSLPWLMNAFDETADRYRFDRLDRGNLEMLRGFDARQILSHHRVPLWKLPFIVRHVRARMQRDITGIEPFPGIAVALEALTARGLKLAIMTSNSSDNVVQILGGRNAGLFHHLECGISLFGKGARLRKLLGASGSAPGEAIFIGDEVRDAQAAAEAGVPFGAVAWGYSHLRTLISHGAQETFNSVAELVTKLAPAG